MRLMINTLTVFTLSLNIASAQWVQDRFAIGAWWDPTLTTNTADATTALTRYVNANFNLLGGWNDDRYSYEFSFGAINNQYILNRVADVNRNLGRIALRACVRDRIFISPPFSMNNYTNLTGDVADALYGYSYMHEPTENELPNQLNVVQDIRAADPSRFTFDILPSIFRITEAHPNDTFQQNWGRYETFISSYFNHASTMVGAFDYYVLSEVNGQPHYNGGGADRVNYYATLNLFAQSARNSSKEFWGVVNGSDRQIDWWQNGSFSFQMRYHPTSERMRWNAYSNLAFGAKGIVWYTYSQPLPTCNPAVGTCELRDPLIFVTRLFPS